MKDIGTQFNNADRNDDNAEQEFYSLLRELVMELSDLGGKTNREERSQDPLLGNLIDELLAELLLIDDPVVSLIVERWNV